MDTPDRFAFGQNWQDFLATRYTPSRLTAAVDTMRRTLRRDRLDGLTFLDVGSGSGLHSVAAHTLGASVRAFDYDTDSVAATVSLAQGRWPVEQGSMLDADFMRRLGTFDVVYCWGVAHHTGDMWRALGLLADAVKPGGTLVLSIYNDQGKPSHRWRAVKRAYHRHPWMRPLLLALAWTRLWAVKFAQDALKGDPLKRWRTCNDDVRGMDAWIDLKDWTGGYPFEVAKPEAIFRFYQARGFELVDMTTQAGGIGCNEYVLRRHE